MKIILILRGKEILVVCLHHQHNKLQNLSLDFFPRKAIQEKQDFNIVLSGLVKEE